MKRVLSCYQAAALLEAREQGLTATHTSFDLARSEAEVSLDLRGISAASFELSWEAIEHVASIDSVLLRRG